MTPAEIKILLVVYNPINVVVMEETLGALGYKADVANSGIQALEKLSMEASHYNIVLMDCDIPKMDGCETTRQIRQGKGGIAYKQVPIIAISSPETEELLDKCSAAGMNDYIIMPIEPKILDQKLSEWTKSHGLVNVEDNVVNDRINGSLGDLSELSFSELSFSELSFSELSFSELPVWDEEEVLIRMRGKKDRLVRIIEMFSENLPQNMLDLEASIEALDMKTARENAHAIKGVAANISGHQLMALMTVCEEACIEENVERTQEILPLCLTQCEQLLEKLRQYTN